MSQSEVAQLRQQIAEEYAAAHRALYEFATVAKHEIITNRFNQAGQYIDQLAQFVGEQEANTMSAQIYIQVAAEETAQKGREQGQAQVLRAPQEEQQVRASLKLKEGI